MQTALATIWKAIWFETFNITPIPISLWLSSSFLHSDNRADHFSFDISLSILQKGLRLFSFSLKTITIDPFFSSSFTKFYTRIRPVRDSTGYWIPRCGFLIPANGFRILPLWIPEWIPANGFRILPLWIPEWIPEWIPANGFRILPLWIPEWIPEWILANGFRILPLWIPEWIPEWIPANGFRILPL